MKNIIHEAKGAKCKLYTLLSLRRSLFLKTILYIHKSYLRLKILYAGPVWSPNLTKASWKNV